MTDGTVTSLVFAFKIKATAEGGVSATKDISLTIAVCGDESLSVVDAAVFEKTLDIGAADFTLDLSSLFTSSDVYCPVQVYAPKTNNDFASQQDPTAAQLLNYFITGNTLTMSAEAEGTFDFYVLATTITNKFVFKKF